MFFYAATKQIRAGHGDEYPTAMEYTALTMVITAAPIGVLQASPHVLVPYRMKLHPDARGVPSTRVPAENQRSHNDELLPKNRNLQFGYQLL